MLAISGETPELAEKTIDFAVELEPEYAEFCFTTPYPGTKLYEAAKKSGKLLNDFSKYNIWEVVFIPEGYKNKEEIIAIEKMAVRKFYFRTKFIFNKLKQIQSIEDLRRYFNGFKMAIGFVS